MTLRKKILLAIANLTTPLRATNTRQIAEYLDDYLGHINCYFYNNVRGVIPFENGDLVQWSEKSNTLRPGPHLDIIRHRGRVIDVGRIEKV